MNLFDRRQISLNVTASIVQVVVAGIALFVIYRYLLEQLGVEEIGVWSMVLAVTTSVRLIDLGLTATVVKYVAQDLAKNDRIGAAITVQTAFLTLTVFVGLLFLGIYPLLEQVLTFVLPQGAAIAIEILPYAVASSWSMAIASLSLGALDGCQRIDLRSALLIAGQLIFLSLTFLWVPSTGLKGVAQAQLGQAGFLAVFSWWFLRRQLPDLPALPIAWRLLVLRGMLGYGHKAQSLNIMAILLDPITKAVMGKFGGLVALGYYEMANKLIMQLRAVIVESNRVIVPLVSQLSDRATAVDLHKILESSLRISLFASATTHFIVVLCSATISFLWIGQTEALFVFFLIALSVGWFFNTLAGPAYFHNLGAGRLGRNLLGQATITALNVVLGIGFGVLWGSVGVAIAFAASLTAGSIVIIFSDASAIGAIARTIKSSEGQLFVRQLFVAGFAFSINFATRSWGSDIGGNVVLIVGGALVAILAWVHWRRHATDVLR